MPTFDFHLNRRGKKYTLNQGQEVINQNDRMPWYQQAPIAKHLRGLSKQAGKNYINTCLKKKTPHKPFDEKHPCRIDIFIKSSNNYHKDGPNLYPTTKPLVDGLVDAGILTDDNDNIVKAYCFLPKSNTLKPKKSLAGDRIDQYHITISITDN